MERAKTMKDYIKYDFEAIRGAYVEMEIAPVENPAVHATINGMVIFQDPKSILVLRKSGTVTGFFRSEIVPGSLTAEIKVEDTSLNQIKQYAETLKNKNGEKEVYFMVNSDVLPNEENKILFFGTDTIGDRYRTEVWLKFSDTIDCTDWWWRE